MATLALDDLHDLFEYLQEQGFPCGIGDRQRACELCAGMPQSYRDQRLRTLLAPVFVRDPRAQQRFYDAFDLYFAIADPNEPPPVGVGEEPLALPAQSKLQYKRRMPRKHLVWAIAVASVALAFWFGDGLGLLRALLQGRPDPPRPDLIVVNEPQPTQGVTYQKTLQRIEQWSTRTCNRWNCVSGPWRPWVLASPLLLLLLYFLLRQTARWKRWMVLGRERRRGPPFEQPVFRAEPQMRAFQELIERASESMRLRLIGDTEEIDVPRTVDATIQAAGFPSIRTRGANKALQFLFLIQERSPQDHFAQWWQSVGARLRMRSVPVDCYTYRGDLRRVYWRSDARPVPTTRLLDLCWSHSVMVFGDSKDLLHRVKPLWAPWGAAIVLRESRALLTAAASFEWTAADRQASWSLPVFSARLRQLHHVAATLASLTPPVLSKLGEEDGLEMPAVPESFLEETEIKGMPPSLKMFLDDDVFEWLCACSVYPRIEWELTLHLALCVDSTGAIFSERKLMQLIHLSWFRQGRMPTAWRSWLIRCLNPEVLQRVRGMLINAISRNRAPRNSHARDQQDVQIAAQRYWLEPNNPVRRTELQVLFDALPNSDSDSDPLVGGLRKTWASERRSLAWNAQWHTAWRRFRLAYLRAAVGTVLGLVATAAAVVNVPVPQKEILEQKNFTAVVSTQTEPIERKPSPAPQPKPVSPVLDRSDQSHSRPITQDDVAPPKFDTSINLSINQGAAASSLPQAQTTSTPSQTVGRTLPPLITDLIKPGDIFMDQATYGLRSAYLAAFGKVLSDAEISGTFGDQPGFSVSSFRDALATIPLLDIDSVSPQRLSLKLVDNVFSQGLTKLDVTPSTNIRRFAESWANLARNRTRDVQVVGSLNVQLDGTESTLAATYIAKDPLMAGVDTQIRELYPVLSRLRQAMTNLERQNAHDPDFAKALEDINIAWQRVGSWGPGPEKYMQLDYVLAHLAQINANELRNLESKLPGAADSQISRLGDSCYAFFSPMRQTYVMLESLYATTYLPRARYELEEIRSSLFRALGIGAASPK